jgi:hypothetical protein
MSEDREEAPELATFSVSECYVYAPIPPATSYGQRAELWDVDKWLKVHRQLATIMYLLLHAQGLTFCV